MAEEITQTVGEIATEGNIEAALNIASDVVSFLLKIAGDAWNLIQENVIWLIVIVALTKLVDVYVLEPYLPIPKGWWRYVIAFSIVMFFDFVWKGIAAAVIGGM